VGPVLGVQHLDHRLSTEERLVGAVDGAVAALAQLLPDNKLAQGSADGEIRFRGGSVGGVHSGRMITDPQTRSARESTPCAEMCYLARAGVPGPKGAPGGKAILMGRVHEPREIGVHSLRDRSALRSLGSSSSLWMSVCSDRDRGVLCSGSERAWRL